MSSHRATHYLKGAATQNSTSCTNKAWREQCFPFGMRHRFAIVRERAPTDSGRTEGARPATPVTLAACDRMMADFEEMPDLVVTTSQAAHFWGIAQQVAEEALSLLVRRGYLRYVRGVYRRW